MSIKSWNNYLTKKHFFEIQCQQEGNPSWKHIHDKTNRLNSSNTLTNL